MSESANSTELTELEGAVLGVVVREGACTSYLVKETFRTSPSEHWGGSAGSIYPLMKRLDERGLLASEAGATGRRARKLYCVTEEGHRAFVRWASDAGRAVGLGYDPLRTRLMFLEQLPDHERQAFCAAVGAALTEAEEAELGVSEPLARLHRIWCRARRRAFEELLSLLGWAV